jgi:hypothetical protein
METYNKDITNADQPEKRHKDHNRPGRVFGGLIIVAVGVVFLARRTGVYFPHWLFSWEMLLIALGIFIGARHSFRGFGWLIPIIIGSIALIDDFYPYADLRDYIWPLVIIVIGLSMIFRPKRRNKDRYWKKWEGEYGAENYGDDFIDSTVIFGNVKKNIISKNFKGGDTVTIFGGTEINLMQADVGGKIVLDMTQIFAGVKLIVPPHWKIQSEDLVAIFGGIEDKRPILRDASIVDSEKILVLKGTCIFGGIDIKSY